MAIVKSVERLQVTITNALEPVTTNLTKGQAHAKCVPWHTARWATDPNIDFNDELHYEVEIIDNSGTAAVKITATARSSTASQIIELSIVEFVTAINVQQVNYNMADGVITVDVSITDVTTQSSAFMLFSAQNEGTANDDFDHVCIRLEWNGAATDSITVDRRTSGGVGSMNGTLYVVDCDDTEFITQISILTNSGTGISINDTITATVIADTFLIHTYTEDQGGDDIRDSVWHADLQSTTVVRAQRTQSLTPSSTSSDHNVQVVECQNSEWSVQHGEISTANDSDTEEITAVDLAKSIVIGTHLEGGLSLPKHDSTLGTEKAVLAHTLTFVDSDTISIDRQASPAVSEIQYQVIEFVLSAAAASKLVVLNRNRGM